MNFNAKTNWKHDDPISENDLNRWETGIDDSHKKSTEIAAQLADMKTEKADKAEVNAFATLKADKTYVDSSLVSLDTKINSQASGSPKAVYSTVAALTTAFPTGNSNIYLVTADSKWYYWSGSAWTAGGVYQATGLADDSVTAKKLSADAYQEVNRRFDSYNVLELKHGQLVNKYVGNNNGSRSLATDTVDNTVASFVSSDDSIPYPIEKVSKMLRLTYTNKTSLFWYKKFAIGDVNKPEVSGFWIKKTDLMKFNTLYNLIWFHDANGTSVNLINPYISTSLVAVGYKKTTVKNGITVTLEIKEQYNDWLYFVQTTDKKPTNATTVGMGLFVSNETTAITGTIDIVGCTQIEGKTELVPYYIYPETTEQKVKTLPEISADIKSINDTLSNDATFKKLTNFGYNLDGALPLLKYRAELAKASSKVVKIACIGDSITEGYWSGLNYERSFPTRLRKLMQARYGGQDEGFVTVYSDDTRWTQTGTWTKVGNKGLGAGQRSSSTAGSKLTFTFTGVGVDIVHSKNTDGGSCVVKIDGVEQTPLNCYTANEIFAQFQSYNGLAPGAHTLEIFAPTDGKTVYVEGAYVKTVGDTAGIRVDRRARSGSFTGDWTSTLMLQTFDTQPADLFILALGINDAGSSRTPEQMKAGLQTIITKLKTKGSVILVPMMQANEVADPRFVNWDLYVQKYYELADENNVGLIDVYELYGKEYQPAQSYGLFGINNGDGEGNDTIHPSARGMQMIANAIFKLIG